VRIVSLHLLFSTIFLEENALPRFWSQKAVSRSTNRQGGCCSQQRKSSLLSRYIRFVIASCSPRSSLEVGLPISGAETKAELVPLATTQFVLCSLVWRAEIAKNGRNLRIPRGLTGANSLQSRLPGGPTRIRTWNQQIVLQQLKTRACFKNSFLSSGDPAQAASN